MGISALALAQSSWNPWADIAFTQQLLADYITLSVSILDAFAKPPWEWPSLFCMLVFSFNQSFLALGHNLSIIWTFSWAAPVIQTLTQQAVKATPATIALIGMLLWMATLRTLLHRWGWPPVARWGALTILATHPALWESLLTGTGWQGYVWTLLLLNAPSIIASSPTSLRPSRHPRNEPSGWWVSWKLPWLTPPVVLGCLLGVSLWVLGLGGLIGALATVLLCAKVCYQAKPHSTFATSSMLRPFCIIAILMMLLSGLASLSLHKPLILVHALPTVSSLLPWLSWQQWTLSTFFSLGGLWLVVALVVIIFHPTAAHLRSWQASNTLSSPTPGFGKKRAQPALCWPKKVWVGGILLGITVSSPPLSAVWLCIGIGQTLTTLNAEAPLRGSALRWLDALGVTLILGGLGAAILLFQWCPDTLPWVSGNDNQTLLSLSVGKVAWEVAWWKLAVSGWLLSLIILGFGLLLRGHRLTGQEGLGLTAASILWGCMIVHTGILPWVQPNPHLPASLAIPIPRGVPFPLLTLDKSLSLSSQQVVVQTLWHSLSQSVHKTPAPSPYNKHTSLLQAVPEARYYQQRHGHADNPQAIAFQQVPVVRLWPHSARGWLDTDALVWVLSDAKP